MARKCVIRVEGCQDCPHFNNEYYSYREWCRRLDRKIPGSIPDDCPLPMFSEDFDDET